MNEDKFGLAPIKAEGSSAPFDESCTVMIEMYEPPEFEILGPEEDWCSYNPNPTTQYVCQCGSKNFTVHYQAGGYETSVICTECQEAYIVHEG